MTFWPRDLATPLVPLKHVCSIDPETLPESTDPDQRLNYVDIGNVTLEDGITGHEVHTFREAPSRARKIVRRGDTIISTVRTYLRAIAHIETSEPECIVSTGFAVIRPNASVDPRYLYRIVQSEPFVESVVAHSTGVSYPAITSNRLGNLVIPLPELPTQRRIADFLDRETARIDELIKKKQRFVKLGHERNKSRVYEILFAKNGPGWPRKQVESGWIDSIPEHWDLQAVWMLFRLGRGRVISHEYIRDNPGPFPVYSSQTELDGMMGGIGTYDFDGDYLTWTTDGANAGTVFFRSGRFNCTNVCGTLKPLDSSISLEYFQRVLSLATASFVRRDINPKLMNDVMARIRVPVPPIAEQHQISARVDQIARPLRALERRANESIVKLRELRSALITAAVTGCINVDTWRRGGGVQRELDQVERAVP